MSPTAPPRIAVTMGDPAGVGPEICLRLLTEEGISQLATPVVFGDAAVMQRAAEVTGLPFPERVVTTLEAARDGGPGLYDLGTGLVDAITPGRVDARCGQAAFHYIESAIESGFDAITTAPINKEALHAAGIRFPGHTEIFANRTSIENFCMMQYSERITCTFVTVHVGYHEVPELLTKTRIGEVIQLTHDALTRIREKKPRLVVCGLNPHAGENGLFGNREEETVVVPAIETARQRGIDAVGPVPPDTAFTPKALSECDAVVCMYHDQGHIPVKALAFDQAVNTTLGLPIVRTSVDHGTAFDIAWKGEADPSSLFHAVRLAAKLA